MKKLMTLVLLLAISLTTDARKLLVKSISHGKVTINGKTLRKGDTFDSKATIEWEDDEQIIHVVNLETHRVERVATQTLATGGMNNIEALLLQKEILAARGAILLTANDVENFFNRRLTLLSAISVETAFDIDDEHFFFLQYVYNGDTINKRLPGIPKPNAGDNGEAATTRCFRIDDSIFTIDSQPLPPFNVDAKLYYYDLPQQTSILMADSMSLEVDLRHDCLRLLRTCHKAQLSANEAEEIIADHCRTARPQSTTLSADVRSFVDNQQWHYQFF